MKYIEKIKNDLAQYIDQEKAEFFPKFFNAFPGGYGEGDRFLGVKVPISVRLQRNIIKTFR